MFAFLSFVCLWIGEQWQDRRVGLRVRDESVPELEVDPTCSCLLTVWGLTLPCIISSPSLNTNENLLRSYGGLQIREGAVTCSHCLLFSSEMQISSSMEVVWRELEDLLSSNAACLFTFLADRIGARSSLESGDDCRKSSTNTNRKQQLRK